MREATGDPSGNHRKWREIDPEKETTYFVTNIPDRVTGTLLWKAFQPHGRVTDAFVPKRKDKAGKTFGFVRCVRTDNLAEVLSNMNTVMIFDRKLKVTLAKFDRDHRKITYEGFNDEKSAWMPKDSRLPGANLGTNMRRQGKSFADAVKNNCASSSNTRKFLEIDAEGPLYPKHCIGRSVIGVAKDIGGLHRVKKMLAECGYNETTVSYLGGLAVLITFRVRAEMEDFHLNKAEGWNDVFATVTPWFGQDIDLDRIAVLKVVGIPICIRDGEVYDKVGRLFGKVVWPAEFSWMDSDNSAGFAYVLTDQCARIDEEIVVGWKGRSYRVWVVEESTSWVPEFEAPEQADTPEAMEEGEFRPDPVVQEEPRAGDRSLVLETSDGMHEVHGDNQDTSHVSAANINYNGNMEDGINAGPTSGGESHGVGATVATPVGPTNFGPGNFNLGRAESFKSRKRARICLSPSLDGSSDRCVDKGAEPFKTSRIDLNQVPPVVFRGNADNGDFIVASSPPMGGNYAMSAAETMETEEQGAHIAEEVFEEAIMVNDEVDKTISVGAATGMNISGVVSKVASEIIGEMESQVDK